MTVSPIENSAPTNTWQAGTSTASTASADKDLFLSLLVAQMKYQDPSSPADQSQFLAQTAQFTMLEKMDNLVELNTQLGLQQAAFGATSMVGKPITYLSEDGQKHTGVVDSVRFDASGPVLMVDGSEVPIGYVVSLDKPQQDSGSQATTEPPAESTAGTGGATSAA